MFIPAIAILFLLFLACVWLGHKLNQKGRTTIPTQRKHNFRPL